MFFFLICSRAKQWLWLFSAIILRVSVFFRGNKLCIFLICLSRPFDEENTSFRALEVLLLDDNKLSSEVFNSLKNLKRSLCYYCSQKYKTENLCNSIKWTICYIFDCVFQAKAFKSAGKPHFWNTLFSTDGQFGSFTNCCWRARRRGWTWQVLWNNMFL